MKQIAIFASGNGSNAAKIIEYFSSSEKNVCISLIVTNNTTAGVLQIAATHNIATLMLNKEIFFQGDAYVAELQKMKIDLIVLAGFLWKISSKLIAAFPNKIINIHPALLPKFGGKGMYGKFVHEAVIANKEKESGITIHFVNEKYDDGKIIFQIKCPVDANETIESLAQKIHALEYKYFSKVIESII